MTEHMRLSVFLALLGLSGGAVLAAAEQQPDPGVRESMRELWHANVGAIPKEQAPSPLDAVVRQLRAIQMSPQRPAAGGVLAPQPTTAPAEVLAGSPQEPPARRAGRQIDPAVLEKLRKLPAGGVASPEELAEALFLTRHFDAASVFYEQALKEAKNDDDKAWLLYQMGNCRRPNDPAAARALYGRILAEHPDSVWSSLADMQSRLIEWQQINNPRGLLQELSQKPGRTSGKALAPTARPTTSQAVDSSGPGAAFPTGEIAGGK